MLYNTIKCFVDHFWGWQNALPCTWALQGWGLARPHPCRRCHIHAGGRRCRTGYARGRCTLEDSIALPCFYYYTPVRKLTFFFILYFCYSGMIYHGGPCLRPWLHGGPAPFTITLPCENFLIQVHLTEYHLIVFDMIWCNNYTSWHTWIYILFCIYIGVCF